MVRRGTGFVSGYYSTLLWTPLRSPNQGNAFLDSSQDIIWNHHIGCLGNRTDLESDLELVARHSDATNQSDFDSNRRSTRLAQYFSDNSLRLSGSQPPLLTNPEAVVSTRCLTRFLFNRPVVEDLLLAT